MPRLVLGLTAKDKEEGNSMLSNFSVHGSLAPTGLHGLVTPSLTPKAKQLLDSGLASNKDDERKEIAEALASQARTLFDNGHFLEAIPLFQGSYKILKSAVTEFNIGRAWVELAFLAEEQGNLEDAKYAVGQAAFKFSEAVNDALVLKDVKTQADATSWVGTAKEYIDYLAALSTGKPAALPSAIAKAKKASGSGSMSAGMWLIGGAALFAILAASKKR